MLGFVLGAVRMIREGAEGSGGRHVTAEGQISALSTPIEEKWLTSSHSSRSDEIYTRCSVLQRSKPNYEQTRKRKTGNELVPWTPVYIFFFAGISVTGSSRNQTTLRGRIGMESVSAPSDPNPFQD